MKCPVCHSKYSIDDLMRENIKDELIELAAFFGKSWTLVMEYCECFRAGQWASVSEKKKLRLFKELKTLFERCEFEYDSKRYRTDKGRILAAIRVVVDAEKYGFRNHNYLKVVMLGGDLQQADGKNCVRPQRLSAEGMTASEEKKQIQDSTFKIQDSPAGEKTGTLSDFLKRKDLEGVAGNVGKDME